MRVPRWAALKVTCPRCGAKPAEPCQGTRGPRASNHVQRQHAYRRSLV